MPIYEYKCCKCRHKFDKLVKLADIDKIVICEKCEKYVAQRQISTGVSGGGTAEPWEYEYTHKMKPKFVKDSQGNRQKFDPTKHTKGRKGSGK